MDYVNAAVQITLIWTIAVMTPGANVILTMNTALTGNRRLARSAAFVVSAAVLLWSLLGATGLLVILKAFPWLQTSLKVLGGCYLLWLGISKIISTRKNGHSTFSSSNQPQSLNSRKLFTLSFVTSLLNPKTGLFVISLFSVVIKGTVTWPFVFMAMSIMGVITLLWHLFLSFAFSRARAQKAYQKVSNIFDYFTGGLFTLFGAKMLASG
ncbi:LysE family translocator [Endozoicomonas arenosclerae]|uniref:LysE family translocator n=1 Tax=Endozoicomonas arenosclerae TaxID=1633495 RepID=UPI0007812FC7|nr:LysE family transporter [Endozoicomonas arenosclerae]